MGLDSHQLGAPKSAPTLHLKGNMKARGEVSPIKFYTTVEVNDEGHSVEEEVVFLVSIIMALADQKQPQCLHHCALPLYNPSENAHDPY